MLERLKLVAVRAIDDPRSKQFQRGTILILKFVLCCIYTKGVYSGRINPTIPSWWIITIAVTMVYAAFVAEHKKLIDGENISNTADTVLVWAMLLVVMIWGRGSNTHWKTFDVISAVLGACIMAYWAWEKLRVKTNPAANNRVHLAMQGVMTLAFMPLFWNLWWATTNPESFTYWRLVLVSEAIGVFQAHRGKSVLPMVYCTRAVCMALGTLGLMLLIEHR